MAQKKHLKPVKILICTMLLVVFTAITIWAGTWEPQDGGGYKYQQDDGTYLSNTWLQENGKWVFL